MKPTREQCLKWVLKLPPGKRREAMLRDIGPYEVTVVIPEIETLCTLVWNAAIEEAANTPKYDCDCGMPCDCYSPNSAKWQILKLKVTKDNVCSHGIHMDNACGACVPARGTK